MTTTITVWTKPRCIQCTMVKRLFDRDDVPYDELDITAPENAAMLQSFQEQGLASAPITEYEGRLIAGFRDEELKDLIAKYKADRG